MFFLSMQLPVTVCRDRLQDGPQTNIKLMTGRKTIDYPIVLSVIWTLQSEWRHWWRMFRLYFTVIDSFMGSQMAVFAHCNLLKTSFFLQNHHRKLCSKEITNESRCITLELWLQRVLWKTIKTIILILGLHKTKNI